MTITPLYAGILAIVFFALGLLLVAGGLCLYVNLRAAGLA
jgi:hypothetical protein